MNSTGLFTGENYGDIFRSISNKRRSGTLDVTINGDVIRIAFYNGKVVDALKGSEPTAKALIEWLIDGDILSSTVAFDELLLPKELYENLVAQFPGFMPANDFKEMVRERVLDVLFNINFKAGGYYEFRSEVPSFDRDFSPALSVGQLLLDLVSFEADETRFNELFPLGNIVRRTTNKPGALLGGESILYGLLDVPSIVEGLKRASLMSQFGFREALLSLIAEGFIESITPKEIEEDVAPLSSSSESLDSDENKDEDFTSPFLGASEEVDLDLQVSSSDELEEIKALTIASANDDLEEWSSSTRDNKNSQDVLFINPPEIEELNELLGSDNGKIGTESDNYVEPDINTNAESREENFLNIEEQSDSADDNDLEHEEKEVGLATSTASNDLDNYTTAINKSEAATYYEPPLNNSNTDTFERVSSKPNREETKELTNNSEYDIDADNQNETNYDNYQNSAEVKENAGFDYDSVTDSEVTSNISNPYEPKDKSDKIVHSFVSNDKLPRTEEFQRFNGSSVNMSDVKVTNIQSLKRPDEVIDYQLQTSNPDNIFDDILIKPQQKMEWQNWSNGQNQEEYNRDYNEEALEDDEEDTFDQGERYLLKEKRLNILRKFNISTRSLNRSIRMANARFAKSNLLHQFIALAYVISSILAPLYFWRVLLNKF